MNPNLWFFYSDDSLEKSQTKSFWNGNNYLLIAIFQIKFIIKYYF